MSKKTQSPAYQWYPKDILGSKRVMLMSLAEEGAYRRALDVCWLSETLPADPRALARLIGKNCTVGMATRIAEMFVQVNGELRHERLDEERKKQANWSEKSKEGGKKSAEKRKNNKVEANQPINQNATTVQPPLRESLPDGSNQKPTLQFAFASTINTNTLSRVREGFDLNFFKEKGHDWNLPEPLHTALNDFLIYRQFDHADRQPITAYQQVEEILRNFGIRQLTPVQSAERLRFTIGRGAKNVIYDLPSPLVKNSTKKAENEKDITENEDYTKVKSAV